VAGRQLVQWKTVSVDREGFWLGIRALQARVLQGECSAARTGADGDSVADRSCIERINYVCLLKIEPWLLLILDEQAVLYKPAHDPGDDAVQKFVQTLSVRCIDSMKTRLVVLHCVYPVQNDHVEVKVKVQRTAKGTSIPDRLVGFPKVGGLHHRYEWRAAA
jgi:hypothetical protein